MILENRISSFLTAMAYAKETVTAEKDSIPACPFVTLSRETGAGGHTLAETLLRKIDREKEQPLFRGWHIFDAEMCELVLKTSKLRVPLESLIDEEFHGELEDALLQMLANRPSQESVIRKVFRAIRTVARFGKVIVVGRGAACLTRDLPQGIHLRLVAPLSDRVAPMTVQWHVTEKVAQKRIAVQDAARAKLVRVYFNEDIQNPLLYHAVLNTANVSRDEATRLAMEMIEARQKPALENSYERPDAFERQSAYPEAATSGVRSNSNHFF